MHRHNTATCPNVSAVQHFRGAHRLDPTRAVRAARSAPWASLGTAAQVAGVTTDDAVACLVGLGGRGRCDTHIAEMFTTLAPAARVEAISSRWCPPHLARRWTGAFLNTYVPGTSGWPSRRLVHPAAPRQVLVAAARGVERNREAAAEHLAAPAAILQRLAAHREYGVPVGAGVRWRTAQNPNCGPATLAQLVCEHDDDMNIAAALNPNCGPATLAVLAADRSWKVRNAAAQNPNCGPLTLNRLAGDEDWWVRMPTAANPSCDADVLTRFAVDDNHDVRALVAQNPSCPPEVLARLAEDSHSDVSEAAIAAQTAHRG